MRMRRCMVVTSRIDDAGIRCRDESHWSTAMLSDTSVSDEMGNRSRNGNPSLTKHSTRSSGGFQDVAELLGDNRTPPLPLYVGADGVNAYVGRLLCRSNGAGLILRTWRRALLSRNGRRAAAGVAAILRFHDAQERLQWNPGPLEMIEKLIAQLVKAAAQKIEVQEDLHLGAGARQEGARPAQFQVRLDERHRHPRLPEIRLRFELLAVLGAQMLGVQRGAHRVVAGEIGR